MKTNTLLITFCAQ